MTPGYTIVSYVLCKKEQKRIKRREKNKNKEITTTCNKEIGPQNMGYVSVYTQGLQV